jgi:hypothetical protein
MSEEPIDVRRLRLAKNQALFRSVNERVATISERFSTVNPVNFVCECAIHDCGASVELSRDEYEAIRRQATRFFVLPGHVFPEVETVVEDHGDYVVVEKFGSAGRVAIATESRGASESG